MINGLENLTQTLSFFFHSYTNLSLSLMVGGLGWVEGKLLLWCQSTSYALSITNLRQSFGSPTRIL